MIDHAAISRFLGSHHPYDALEEDTRAGVIGVLDQRIIPAGDEIYRFGAPLDGLYLIHEGGVEITDADGTVLSELGPGNSFGERGLLRDGAARTGARATERTRLFVLPAPMFHTLMAEAGPFARFFERGRARVAAPKGPGSLPLSDLMTPDPVTLPPETTVRAAARHMAEARISCVLVGTPAKVQGILTTRDLTARVIAEDRAANTPLVAVMTPDPLTLPETDFGRDALTLMTERHISHVPISRKGRIVGIVTQTDLIAAQSLSSAGLAGRIARAADAAGMVSSVVEIRPLLASLTGAERHDMVTRQITDIADAATRRLLTLAEAKLGTPPVPYLWLACGSQGRREQTGVSDQDNCLILDDAAKPEHDAYFKALAQFVSDGLDRVGYFYCPGDMMATADRWRQPRRVWRDYFARWIAEPGPEAQMLASVMFDLRPIGGAVELFDSLQAEVLEQAAQNSIFLSHLVSNALKHTTPLGLFRGFATIRSGEHRRAIDLKHNGVVPVVDLARVYALMGRMPEVNTRARLERAVEDRIISPSGGRDLLDAYDLIAEVRLAHQAKQIKAGEAPGNYLEPATLSDLERSHLRDAFVVVKTMQSALGQGRAMLG
ncbi:CBS domain-containing protein [Rubricella aquisinus]|uniref:CBS domain-containing protein n=1 Tax=Rubricella aquisinus TaxID=2028108 RepID=A0A840WLF9_9RHOB|nr:putative nucleotidyltransferase substrate binding domain-containing protein [Rubricella aquisinus]MBB5515889.1 CBS domain-containing protein [Rubricella aquisinus]